MAYKRILRDEVDRLADEYYADKNPQLIKWEAEEYPHLEVFEENRRTRSLSGHYFASKDDYEYRERNIRKLKKYIEAGYYPMINIITTFMGNPYRIDEQWIETIIENFFEI